MEYRNIWHAGNKYDNQNGADSVTCLFRPSSMPSSVASLDSSSASSYNSDEEYRLAQEEWEESLEQLKQLVSVVLLPFVGKWMGRRWSHWGIRHSDLFSLPADHSTQHTPATSALASEKPSFSATSASSQHDLWRVRITDSTLKQRGKFMYILLGPVVDLMHES